MKIYGMETDLDKNGKVRGAYDSEGTFCVAYKKSNYGGWDNCMGEYTPEQFRRKMKNDTARFI